jgi:hypothetical protein
MNEHETLTLLEALVIDNPELEKLEALLDEFNIFEALGAVRQEVRHSNFLAFLLDPLQNHGLDDVFAKRLLQKAVQGAEDVEVPVTPIDFDLWDLDDIVVLREWRSIDIFMRSDSNRLAVVIENKIGSGEHSEQLGRYRRAVNSIFPGWRILYLFLTPGGDQPSDAYYIPIDYSLVLDLVDTLAESRASTLGPDVRTLMLHYAQMLRRHIVKESEIAELCQNIYQKHKRALDLIYEHRPDLQSEIQRILLDVINTTPELVLVKIAKSQLRFVPDDWLPQLRSEASDRPLLFFEFRNDPNWVRLSLIIGPGPRQARQQLLDVALANRQTGFFVQTHRLNLYWNSIFAQKWLTARDYGDASLDEIEQKLRDRWQRFMKNEFPALSLLVREEAWIWESEQPVVERMWPESESLS